MTRMVLVCGSRKGRFTNGSYNEMVRAKLRELLQAGDIVIEGCCPLSADKVAEEVAAEKGLEVRHHPAIGVPPLIRNVDMVMEADIVYAFWDGYSYGTAQTIAQASLQGKPVRIFSGGYLG